MDAKAVDETDYRLSVADCDNRSKVYRFAGTQGLFSPHYTSAVSHIQPFLDNKTISPRLQSLRSLRSHCTGTWYSTSATVASSVTYFGIPSHISLLRSKLWLKEAIRRLCNLFTICCNKISLCDPNAVFLSSETPQNCLGYPDKL